MCILDLEKQSSKLEAKMIVGFPNLAQCPIHFYFWGKKKKFEKIAVLASKNLDEVIKQLTKDHFVMSFHE